MKRAISVITTKATGTDLHRSLTGINGVEPSEIDDWNGTGSSLDAPFNPWRPDQGLVAVTAMFDDKARAVVIDRLATLQGIAGTEEELLLLDPATGSEIGRVRPGATVEDVARLLERAPQFG